MSPTISSHPMRRATAFLAIAWALSAILPSVAALHPDETGVDHPFEDVRLGRAAVVYSTHPSASAAGIAVGDRIVAFEGRPFFPIAFESGAALRPGVPSRYEIEKPDGRRIEVELPPVPILDLYRPFDSLVHGLLLVVAIIYLGTGGVVYWLRPENSGAWALLLFCCTLAVQLAITLHTDHIQGAMLHMVANAPLIGATTFQLFTTYPIQPGWVVRHPRVQVLPYLGAGLLAALSLAEGRLGLPPGVASELAFFYMATLVWLSLGILAVERRRHLDGPMREAADVVTLAALVSFVPVLAVFLVEWLTQEPYPFYLALLWTFVFPVAVGYGIVYRQLFDLRNVARSSAAYGIASIGITGAFALLITFADSLVSDFGVSTRSAQVALLFIAILLFNPVRDRMQSLADRFFDRDRAAYRVAVREISEAMVSMLSLGEIADRILVALTDTMGVERAIVLLVEDEERVLRPIASRGEWEDAALSLEISSDHPIWKQLWMRREDLTRSDFDDENDLESREACRDVYDTLEVELLVPILYGVDLLGVIAVGRKLSGDRLAADDRLLLRTLANQSSIAIENAKAFDEIAKLNETLEARVEERTNELREIQGQLMQAEKMKSLGQLVAGVAHELNNPIGFVHANLQLLDEYVQKLSDAQARGDDTTRIREAIAKLILRSREGTQRVKKIVQDLRTYSRMDQAEIQDVSLHEEIDRNLALMEPRFKTRIRVQKNYGDVPRVRCYAGQLNQVFLNLLMNACDAIEEDGTIQITTLRIPGGVRLEFTDDGPGIPEEIRSRIFDPFFTTKPVGVGTGLGLSLSHGIIERHGGKISVDSEPGRGTTFAIELPLDATPVEG
jgi:signal transduction histidine kinase